MSIDKAGSNYRTKKEIQKRKPGIYIDINSSIYYIYDGKKPFAESISGSKVPIDIDANPYLRRLDSREARSQIRERENEISSLQDQKSWLEANLYLSDGRRKPKK